MPDVQTPPAWVELAGVRLNTDLVDWLIDRRHPENRHDPVPGWRRLADELAATVHVTISHNSLREYYLREIARTPERAAQVKAAEDRRAERTS